MVTSFIDCRPGSTDVIFLLDSSVSTNTSITKMQEVMRYFINKQLTGANDVRIAAVQYSLYADILSGFRDHRGKRTLNAMIDSLKHRG